MTITTNIGQKAESLVSEYLQQKGHKVLFCNWRTKLCEIDIVSKKNDIVYCCEVRYRKSSNWGNGFDSITSKKLKQVNFAAELWAHNNKWDGPIRILIAAVSGEPLTVDDIIEL
ncbi:MAG: ribonuclease [Patescibacteria group bacterium]|nr:ribonuclease [Patescibacteria group bacterium]MDQ5958614.1 ribonuclease [Patescibacteria group bacterium]